MRKRQRLWVKAGARPSACCASARRTTSGRWAIPVRAVRARRFTTSAATTCRKNVAALVNGPGDDTMEIWNLVFMQYDRDADGMLTPLPAPSVDTGAGPGAHRHRSAESGDELRHRSLRADHGAHRPKSRGHRYARRMDDELDTAVRVLCDHARAATFLISDGVIPSNEGRGYVLRRIIRRAIRFGRKLPKAVVLSDLVDAVIEAMGGRVPGTHRAPQAGCHADARSRRGTVLAHAQCRHGARRRCPRRSPARGERTLGGEEVFRLYDTFGIPLDLIAELAEDEGVALDREGFEAA